MSLSERIITAAIKHNGKIYTGSSHGNIMQEMTNSGVKGEFRNNEQGFLTDKGRFVNRVEAAKIAREAGQIKKGYADVYSLDSYEVNYATK